MYKNIHTRIVGSTFIKLSEYVETSD